MSFPVPTLTALRSRIEADFNTRLPGADSRLRRSVLWVLSYVGARTAWGLYTFLGWISKQTLPDTADDDQLDRLGGIEDIPRTAIGFAAGTATVTGVNGSPISAGTSLQTADNTVYTTQTDVEIAGGTATITVRAALAGSAGNQGVGTQLSFVAPVSGVDVAAVVISIKGGVDVELDDPYRARLLDHLRAPPQGGAQGNYVQWAKEIAGVTRAWEVADWQGAGTVGVLFVFDGRDDIFPLADDVTAMQAHLDAKRPITTAVYAVAPIANPQTFSIALNPANDAIRASVSAELADLLAREGTPGSTLLLTHIEGALSLAVGAGDFRLIAPVANVTQGPAQMMTLAAPNWVAW